MISRWFGQSSPEVVLVSVHCTWRAEAECERETPKGSRSHSLLCSVCAGGVASADSDYDIRGIFCANDRSTYSSIFPRDQKAVQGFSEDRLYDVVHTQQRAAT